MKTSKRIGILEVARLAGVSATTVSRVLNGRADSRISLETQERVRATAHRAGYVVNRLATSLRTHRTGVFGAIVNSLSGHYQPHLTSRLQAAAQRRGVELLVAQAMAEAGEVAGQLRLFQEDFFDGVIMVSDLPGQQALCDHLDRMGKAHVTLGAGLTGPLPAVLTDDRHGIHLLFDHLKGLGHRHISFVYRISRSALRDRLSIFEELVAASAGSIVGDVISFEKDERDRRLLAELLASPKRPTALICGSDGLAIEVVAFLRDLGLRIPDDISVVGYDNVPDTAFWTPPLTTVAQPTDSLCEASLDLLVELANLPVEARVAKRPMRFVTPELVIRASSSSPSLRPFSLA
ncbi:MULTISPECIES: LacI family DNA-binding transcriptional regulator [unclassified Rhizobium]|uniref:LacI family DNA-binding transcriptional regulator n=1 Tax=unclassified Rhizobium TaxID=2613769 RepID=UPI000EA8D821|nr:MULTISPECIES: LacI family DNA-binding transcriptional regulator [unclassified Rhizobium]AYG70005.1 LacI family transcriptional regulator [Rhizobium sp. CCGE531]AYG76381.1 LacI family transcriptional regulator [Rhizobium sp. CCGE532]